MMNGEGIKGNRLKTSGNQREEHQHLVDQAYATAQRSIENSETQASRTDDAIDVRSGQEAEIDLRHNHTQNGSSAEIENTFEQNLEQLSDAELFDRSKQILQRVHTAEPNSEEFKQAYQQHLDMTRESMRRHKLKKEGISETISNTTQDSSSTQEDHTQDNDNYDVIKPATLPENLTLREKIAKKIKSKPAYQRFAKTAAVAAVAVVVGISAFGITSAIQNAMTAQASEGAAIERVVEHNRAPVGSPESYRGFFADDSGSIENPNKGTTVDFAGPNVLSEARNNPTASKEGIKDVSMQVETLAGYLMALNDTDRAELGVTESNLQEIVAHLESDSDYCQKVSDGFLKMVDNGKISYDTVSGKYTNLYMQRIDPNGGFTKENIKVVACETDENDTAVTILTTDNGSTIKIKDGCAQPIGETGAWSTALEGTVHIVTPTPGPQPQPQPDPPGPTPTPWGKSGDTHAGDGIFNKDLVNPATEVSEYQSDHANDGNKGGQTGTDTGVVDRGGNAAQKDTSDRGSDGKAVDHTDQQEEERVKKGDF